MIEYPRWVDELGLTDDILTRLVGHQLSEDFFGNFDASHYARVIQEAGVVVFRSGADKLVLLRHYLEVGWLSGFSPNSWFDVAGYLCYSPDVASAGVEPLNHYLTLGRLEGRCWTQLGDTPIEVVGRYFEPEFYYEQNPDIDREQVSALEHYCIFGWLEGRDPAPWFSVSEFLKHYPNFVGQQVEPFNLYLQQPADNRAFRAFSRPLPLGCVDQPLSVYPDDLALDYADVFAEFNANFYKTLYPDIRGSDIEAFAHFMTHGSAEGRDPVEWFSTRMYADAHREILPTGTNSFLHYIRIGRDKDLITYPAVTRGPVTLKLDKSSTLVLDHDIRGIASKLVPGPIAGLGQFDPAKMSIHWVIPDFDGPSGGHSTIFRLARWMEFAGHEITFWLYKPTFHETEAATYDDVAKNFQPIKGALHFLDERLRSAKGDVVFATGWQTVADVTNAAGFLASFYLVQDFEPYFSPVGSKSIAAGLTYESGLSCVCASPWLASKLAQEYDCSSSQFELAYDPNFYFRVPSKLDPDLKINEGQTRRFRIAVYARIGTERRCVELALLGLELLALQRSDFEVVLFASDNKLARAPFPCTVYGFLSPEELGELYRSCDVGICFSATNYSLVPQEMMACGLPVVELDVESSRAVFPVETVVLTGPSPKKIASDLNVLLSDPLAMWRQAEAGFNWVRDRSWLRSSEQVLRAIDERLTAQKHRRLKPMLARPSVKASVCIPTFNGGELLFQVLAAVADQRTPWEFEVLVTDSSSTDGTLERLRRADTISLVEIEACEFGHGKTRNTLAARASGQFLVFITQDALPTSVDWLYNLVTSLEHFPNAAGAFGRHIAYPSSCPLTRRDIAAHFDAMAALPICVYMDLDPVRWDTDTAWRQCLHFYSDNNSCLRREVWAEIPFPDVEYGEDQLWAMEVLRRGFQKVYSPLASVYHSHDYVPSQIYERAKTEARFFKNNFGYDLFESGVSLDDQVARRNAADQSYVVSAGLPMMLMIGRSANNYALTSGWRDGLAEAVGSKCYNV